MEDRKYTWLHVNADTDHLMSLLWLSNDWDIFPGTLVELKMHKGLWTDRLCDVYAIYLYSSNQSFG